VTLWVLRFTSGGVLRADNAGTFEGTNAVLGGLYADFETGELVVLVAKPTCQLTCSSKARFREFECECACYAGFTGQLCAGAC
jgi:hypothetical protein